MLEEMLADAGLAWRDLDAIGVGVGPGNFTGIRIAIATARGLSLALGVPAIGVSGFEAACPAPADARTVLIDAPRDQVYAQRVGGGADSPRLIPRSEGEDLPGQIVRLSDIGVTEMVTNIARIARERRVSPQDRPAPLYIRPADAAPSRDAPPVILP
jgi:tRNA threonylcarbamoyl adenosine modification protein YeaZ